MDKAFLEQLIGNGEVAQTIWQEHQRIVDDYESRLQQQVLDHAVQQAVTAAGGRSEKAIRALLDQQGIAGAEDVFAAARQAVQALKQEQPYLFSLPQVYSPGTGTDRAMPVSSADVAAMSMAEYRRYRGK